MYFSVAGWETVKPWPSSEWWRPESAKGWGPIGVSWNRGTPWNVMWMVYFIWLVVTGTFLVIFPYIWNFIIPIDELIFFRGVQTTKQSWKIPFKWRIRGYPLFQETTICWMTIIPMWWSCLKVNAQLNSPANYEFGDWQYMCHRFPTDHNLIHCPFYISITPHCIFTVSNAVIQICLARTCPINPACLGVNPH